MAAAATKLLQQKRWTLESDIRERWHVFDPLH